LRCILAKAVPMALLVSLVVSLVFIVILVIATLAVEIDRLPDDPGNGRVSRHAPLEQGSA
jgi:hypothetical protein